MAMETHWKVLRAGFLGIMMFILLIGLTGMGMFGLPGEDRSDTIHKSETRSADQRTRQGYTVTSEILSATLPRACILQEQSSIMAIII